MDRIEKARREAAERFLATRPSERNRQEWRAEERAKHEEEQAVELALGMKLGRHVSRHALDNVRRRSDDEELERQARAKMFKDMAFDRRNDVDNANAELLRDQMANDSPKPLSFGEQWKLRNEEYSRGDIPIGATVIDKTQQSPIAEPEQKKKWYNIFGGGAGYAIGNVALAAVVVAASIIGSA